MNTNTVTIFSQGQERTYTAVELVELAFARHGVDPRDLHPDFIRYWLAQAKDVEEILAIAGVKPSVVRTVAVA